MNFVQDPPTPAPPAPPPIPEFQIPDFPVVVGQGGPPWETMPPQVFVLVFLAMIAGAVIILWPLMRALGRRLEGRVGDPALRAEMDDLRSRMLDVEGQQVRIAELEERVDFAERLLAQSHDKPRIGDR